MAEREFTWRDGERTIRFRRDAIADALDELDAHDWDRYELLTTRRALECAPLQLAGGAERVHWVPPGPVNQVSARLIEGVECPTLIALGGGRVIDAAKAIAAVQGGRVAALPTTLSGAEMTAIHRFPDGHAASHRVRPQLVLADPFEMTSLPEERLRASAMNALAHGADSLYTPLANPVARLAALDGAKRIARGLAKVESDAGRTELAEGALLCGYAIDSAGLALHHVVAQTLVRTMRLPHAETNAAILPRAMEAMRPRASKRITELARALGARRDAIGDRIDELAGGRRRLGELGADEALLEEALDAMLARKELAATPHPPGREELRDLVQGAW